MSQDHQLPIIRCLDLECDTVLKKLRLTRLIRAQVDVLRQIEEASVEYWINWNYDTTGEEWMDDNENAGPQHDVVWQNKIDETWKNQV